jgi:hypothetical protein
MSLGRGFGKQIHSWCTQAGGSPGALQPGKSEYLVTDTHEAGAVHDGQIARDIQARFERDRTRAAGTQNIAHEFAFQGFARILTSATLLFRIGYMSS